jgi:hypothetical protein
MTFSCVWILPRGTCNSSWSLSSWTSQKHILSRNCRIKVGMLLEGPSELTPHTRHASGGYQNYREHLNGLLVVKCDKVPQLQLIFLNAWQFFHSVPIDEMVFRVLFNHSWLLLCNIVCFYKMSGNDWQAIAVCSSKGFWHWVDMI